MAAPVSVYAIDRGAVKRGDEPDLTPDDSENRVNVEPNPGHGAGLVDALKRHGVAALASPDLLDKVDGVTRGRPGSSEHEPAASIPHPGAVGHQDAEVEVVAGSRTIEWASPLQSSPPAPDVGTTG